MRKRQLLVSPLPVDICQHSSGPGPLRRQLACRFQFFDGPFESPKFPVDHCQVYSGSKVLRIYPQSLLVEAQRLLVFAALAIDIRPSYESPPTKDTASGNYIECRMLLKFSTV